MNYLRFAWCSVLTKILQHTSFSATSPCTMQAVRDYFRNGTLPTAGMVCEVEESMFGIATSQDRKLLARDDTEFANAVRQLVKNTKVSSFGLLS
jgi:hypothetical protein